MKTSKKTIEGLAFDRASVRTIDQDGRLHVEITNISKAAVNPYYGREIPNSEALGLDPDRVYQLLRDPKELALGAASFNNIPLLNKHVPVHADEPQKEFVVGSTGTDAAFDGVYLKNSLVVWDSSAIAGIQTHEQKELSSAYRYVADMTSGIFDGVPYDGRMTQIVGNHVALVEVGRAGADVVVSDSLPKELFMKIKPSKTAVIRAALGTHLLPMAQDSADLALAVKDLTKGATTIQKLAMDAKAVFNDVDVKALTASLKFALDASEDDEEDLAEDDDDEEKAKKVAEDADDDEESDDKKANDTDEEDDDKVDKKAMDAAISKVRDGFKLIRQAEADVRSLVGEVVAMDSAEDVYKFAMDQLGIDHKGVHASAYPALIAMHKKSINKEQPKLIAQDAASVSELAEIMPNAFGKKGGK